MPSYEALAAYQRGYTQAGRAAVQFQRQRVAEVGQAVSVVEGMDGYDVWLRHLDVLLEDAKRRRAAALEGMAAGNATGKPLADTLVDRLVEIRWLDGRITGLEQARELIPQLVKRGQEADGNATS